MGLKQKNLNKKKACRHICFEKQTRKAMSDVLLVVVTTPTDIATIVLFGRFFSCFPRHFLVALSAWACYHLSSRILLFVNLKIDCGNHVDRYSPGCIVMSLPEWGTSVTLFRLGRGKGALLGVVAVITRTKKKPCCWLLIALAPMLPSKYPAISAI